MKAIGFFVIGVVALLASLAVACGGNDDTAAVDGPAPGVSGGLVARDQFMTYDGHRYELVNMIFESMLPADEFQPVGTVSQSDVDLTDRRVFSRAGDTTAVYTHSAPTPDDNGFWLAWRLAS